MPPRKKSKTSVRSKRKQVKTPPDQRVHFCIALGWIAAVVLACTMSFCLFGERVHSAPVPQSPTALLLFQNQKRESAIDASTQAFWESQMIQTASGRTEQLISRLHEHDTTLFTDVFTVSQYNALPATVQSLVERPKQVIGTVRLDTETVVPPSQTVQKMTLHDEFENDEVPLVFVDGAAVTAPMSITGKGFLLGSTFYTSTVLSQLAPKAVAITPQTE